MFDLDLSAQTDPFAALIDHLGQVHDADGHIPDLARLAWLLPRVEQAAGLRQALAARHSAGFAVSPVIITTDRLSDHAGSVNWLELRMSAYEALGQVPELTAQARSPSQLWTLADEYLTLAHACVASGGHQTVQDLADANPLAGPEARIVLTLAQVFHDDLAALQAPAPAHPGWLQTQGIVWLDDGDPAAQRWLQRHAAHRMVWRARLVSIADEPPLQTAGSGTQQSGIPPSDVSTPVLLQAPQADAAAHMAASQILQWLAQNPGQTIGVAVVDRLMARRVRSLLESAGVLTDDRTGWRLSTTRLAGWLDALLRGWLLQDWTLWLAAMEPARIPLLQTGLPAQLRVVWAARASSRPLETHWDSLRADALMLAGETTDAALRHPVDELLAAFDGLGTHDRALCSWAADALTLLGRLQALPALQADSVGTGLLVLLRSLARSRLTAQCNASFFLLVLGSEMESARIRPQDITSPVRFMPLLSFRLQRFSRVMVLGAARRHFMPSPPGLLPPSVAGELGLADPWLQRSQSLWALAELLQHTPQCALVHQSQSEGQPDPLLGWLRALGLQRQVKGHADWTHLPPSHPRETLRTFAEPLVAGRLPQPASLPVKALADLSACPLKFVLGGLAGLRDLQPGVPDNRSALLRGLWIHDVLERLWRDVGVPAGDCSEALWISNLQAATLSAWRALQPALRTFLFADKLEFERTLPSLARVLSARHAQGWRLQMQEERLRASLLFHPGYEPVTVVGRLDRLERNDDAVAIVDVKTGSAATLAARARQWLQYPQLPLYAWMLDDPCDTLEYLAVRGKKPGYIRLSGESAQQMAQQVRDHLAQILAGLFVHAQQAQPQPGDECRYCDHAGTCRSSWLKEAT